MHDLIDHLTLIMCGAGLMLSFLGLCVAIVLPGIDRWTRRFFIAFFTVFLIYISFCILDVLTANIAEILQVNTIVTYMESLFLLVLLQMVTIFLLHSSDEDLRTSSLFYIITNLNIIELIMLQFTLNTKLFYYIDENNGFSRGPWYPLICAPVIASLVAILAGLIRRRKKLQQKRFYTLVICLLPLTILSFVHLYVSVFSYLSLCMVFFIMSMFSIILLDLIEQYVKQQEEIARQRANIMVLQMRPHFIYNTMTSIYYLCEQDPQKAKKVTLDFTKYLRKNFTAIVSESTVPFHEELEHTRAYLAVEQAQFEDTLFVDYDTPHTNFRLPPLTLQPIVENAVKYGHDPDSDPLHITIQTRETEAGSEIIVEDDGPGFKAFDVTTPHIALDNIRQRLEMMCGGKITITERDGGGTAVKIMIP